MTYHLKNWEYFIEMSCFIPGQIEEILSYSLGIKTQKISSTTFARIVNMAKCARTRDGLETIMLLTLAEYTKAIDLSTSIGRQVFDKFLENLDIQMEGLKDAWAENHRII